MKLYILYVKKYWWVLIILFLFIVISTFGSNKGVEIEKLDNELSIISDEKLEDDTIKVDVKGYVKNPGMYELNVGSRLNDALIMAGGLLSEADTNTINLSKILSDQMVIIVYSKEEIKSMTEGNTTIKYVDKECNCPVVENNACPEEVITNLPEDNTNVGNVDDGKISINTANIEQLDQLPGIGLSKAQDIIDYRTNNGSFKTIEDIKNVSGIGEVIFDKIKDLIKI